MIAILTLMFEHIHNLFQAQFPLPKKIAILKKGIKEPITSINLEMAYLLSLCAICKLNLTINNSLFSISEMLSFSLIILLFRILKKMTVKTEN